MYNANSERFFTPFYYLEDVNDPTDPGTDADPLDFVGKMSYVRAAVKVESILVSSSNTTSETGRGGHSRETYASQTTYV
jgi:hypothetical protein